MGGLSSTWFSFMGSVGAMNTLKNSYVAANEIPWKLMLSKDAIKNNNIHPYHIQLIPTNRCNSKCVWCSCKNVNRSEEMDYYEILRVINHFYSLGTKAITISGGGEPTLHPRICDIITYCAEGNIDVGMVSNGSIISGDSHLCHICNKYLTWLRLSVTDTEGDSYDTNTIRNIASSMPYVDIGISFTVTNTPNMDLVKEICEIAEGYTNITHIRFVSEIVHGINNGIMEKVKEISELITTKGIYQERAAWTKGEKQCLVSKLRPVIDPDGQVYPCCGTQYAKGATLQMDKNMSMGHWSTFTLDTPYFDGSVCNKCYYDQYQKALNVMINPPWHINFL
jgi:hypothetical protein